MSDFAPAWSPNGSDLVFVQQENNGAARHLYTLALATGTVKPLTPGIRWANSPDWRPDTAHGGASVAKGGAALVQGATLRLPRGHPTTTFTITAPAEHAYDVTVAAPATSAIVLTMKIPAVANERVLSPAGGWTVNTLHDSDCHQKAGHTDCLLHFAAGGNPGGRWTGILHKTSVPAAAVHISVVFARQAGSYPG